MRFRSLGIQNQKSNLNGGIFKIRPVTARLKKTSNNKKQGLPRVLWERSKNSL